MRIINPYQFGGGALALDTKNAAMAYSVRKLRTAYSGSCMRIKKVTGGTETDIGFDSNGLVDVAAINTFMGGSGDAFVSTWYDQTGNARNMTNTSAGPLVYQSGASLSVDGFPTLQFDTGRSLTNFTFLTALSDYACAAVAHVPDRAGTYAIVGNGAGSFIMYVVGTEKLELHRADTAFVLSSSNAATAGTINQLFASGGNNASESVVVVNGTTATLAGTKLFYGPTYIGYGNGGAFPYNERMFEVIIYNEVFGSTDRGNIVANQRTYFGTP